MKLPERVIIHAGMTKAGSTILQNFLDRSREALLEKGILFPASPFTRKDPNDPLRTSGHLELLRMLQRGDISAFKQELVRTKPHTLLLSAENLMMRPRPPGFEAFCRLVAHSRVELVILLRDQMQWLGSWYYEAVTKGWARETRGFDRYCLDAIEQGMLDYADDIRELGQSLQASTLRLLDYSALTARDEMLSATLEAMDCPLVPDAEFQARHDNASLLDPDVIEALRRLNGIMPKGNSKVSLAVSHQLRQEASEQMAPSSGMLCPSPGVQRRLSREIAEMNRKLSATYLDGQPFGTARDCRNQLPRPSGRARQNALFDKGLEILGQLDKTTRRIPHGLLARCRENKVLLCDDPSMIRFLAAALPDQLIFCLASGQDNPVTRQWKIDRVDAPGKVIFGKRRETPARSLGTLWNRSCFRHPDLVLLSDANSTGMLSALHDRICQPVTVLRLSGPDQPWKEIRLKPRAAPRG